MAEITNNMNAQASNAYGRQSIQSLASSLRKNFGESNQATQNSDTNIAGTGGSQQAVGAGTLLAGTNGLKNEAATLQISRMGKEKVATMGAEQQKQADTTVALTSESLMKIQNVAERIRRVAIASSGGSADRGALATEFEGLRGEMDKLLEGTKFNSTNLGSEKTKLSELDLTKGTGNGEEAWIAIDRAMDTLRPEVKRTMSQPPVDAAPRMSASSISTASVTSSESKIRDVDIAAEMEKFKAVSLSQARQTILSQANSTPQGVMGLLR